MTTARPRLLARTALLAGLLALAPAARAGAPSDELLRLTPARAGAVLVVDDLRGRWDALAGSRLAREFAGLPAFAAWRDSPGARDFFQARDRIMGFLQVTPRQVRDDLLGDAAALALLMPDDPALDASHARGLLLLKARDPGLLRRLIDRVNRAQRDSGELESLVESERGGTPYATRRFAEGSGQLPETYVLFPDGVFAFSNDEPLVHEVIDRKAGKGGASFADASGFREAAEGLAGRPVARAFVDPAAVLRVLDGLPAQEDPNGRKVAAAAREYLGAMDRAGAGLIVEEGRVQLQLVQSFKPDAFRRLAGSVFAPFQTGDVGLGPSPRLLDFPRSAVAAASFRVDVTGLYRFVVGLASDADQARLAKLEAIASALLLGMDLRERVLPALGPRMSAYVEAAEGGTFPLVAAIEINEGAAQSLPGGRAGATTAEALDNALRAVLTALSLDEKRVPPTAQVRVRDGVASLDAPYPFAFAIDPQARRLILGTSAAAVARYLESGADADAGARFRDVRDAAFPDCEAFACADLAALVALADEHRDRLVSALARRQGRPADDAARDLAQALDLARLFDAAYVAGRVETPRARVEHRVGLLPRREAKAEAEAATP